VSAEATISLTDELDGADLRNRFRFVAVDGGSAGRPRILHICTRFSRGGSEQRLRDIVAALPDHDHHVVVGGESDLDLVEQQLPKAEVHLEPHLRRALGPRHDLAALASLIRRIRDGKYAAVVTHQSKAGVLGRLAARAAGRPPLVHSLSMVNFGPGYSRLESCLFRAVERLLERWTSAYVVVGADLARRFQRLGVPAEKMAVIRSAVRLPGAAASRSEARSRVAETFGLPAERPWILYVGSLDERKNVLGLPILLQQTLQLSVRLKPFLVVAGSGHLERQFRSLVGQIGLDDDCKLLGYVNDPGDLFVASDALVLLSQAEGLPQVLVQAAAVGTPFVATAVDGADELLELGASGSIVDERDVVGAARALLPYLRWPTESCEPTIDLSSWDGDRVSAEYESVFRSILTGGGPPAASNDVPAADPRPAARDQHRHGAVVALIGSDGSGKSTLTRALVETLGTETEVLHLYFGSGDGPSSLVRWPLKRVQRAVFGAKGTTPRKEAVHRRAPRTVRASRSVWALALASEKQTKLRRARRASKRGVLVICDRYPQAQVPGSTDGPLLDGWATSQSRWRRTLAKWEARPYALAHRAQPDLVLRLRVDQPTAERRRPDHDGDELLQRRRLVEELHFDSASLGVVEIDANRSFADVLDDARASIESHLHPSVPAAAP